MHTHRFSASASCRPLVAGLFLIIGVCPPGSILNAGSPPAGEDRATDLSSPKSTFATFLRAVKADDLPAAKRCWVVSDDNKSGILDVLVGDWITRHRLEELERSRFGARSPKAARFGDDSFTDEAIDRTLERLKDAEVQVHGTTVKIWMNWKEEDAREGYPVFFWNGEFPIAHFRLVKDGWKIDANEYIGLSRPADFFEPEAWFYFDPESVAIAKQILAGLESGKLRTREQVAKEWDAKWDAKWKARADRIEMLKQTRRLDPARTRLLAATKIEERWTREFGAGRVSAVGVCIWARRRAEAEIGLARSKTEKLAAAEDYLDRVREVRAILRRWVALGRRPFDSYVAADFYVAEAETFLADLQPEPGPGATRSQAVSTRLATASQVYETGWPTLREEKDKRQRRLDLPWAAEWSRRSRDAAMALSFSRARVRAAAQDHLDRMRELEKLAKAWLKGEEIAVRDMACVTFYRAEAEGLLARLKGEKQLVEEAARQQLAAAKTAFEGSKSNHLASVEDQYQWSLNWQRAATVLAKDNSGKMAALQDHRSRMNQYLKPVKELVEEGRTPTWELWAMEYFVSEAEIRLAEARAE